MASQFSGVRCQPVGQILTGVFCLTCNLGCLTPFQGIADPAPPGGPGDAHAAKPELAPSAAARVSFTVAEEMEKTGHDAEAVVFYERARQSDAQRAAWPWTDHVQVSRQLARLYDRLGDTPHALAEYERALKENPRDVNLLNRFGYFYYSRGKWAEAEEQLRHALALDPRHKRAWVNLGLTLGEQGRYAESLEAFQKAVSEAEAHSNLAFIFTTQGKREEAKQEYRRAVELDPNLVIAQRALDKLEHPGAARAAARPPMPARPDGRPPLPVVPNRPAEPAPDLTPVTVDGPPSPRARTGDGEHALSLPHGGEGGTE
jgi:tetratricopeptide (TPR) repeat protein